MQVLYNMGVSPEPINLNINNNEIEVCMNFAGNDIDNRISNVEIDHLESAINLLSDILQTTNLFFVDLCLQFNPGNIVYNLNTKKLLLIDIDMNWIRLVKNNSNDYWKDILNVYKEYALRNPDDEYDDDPYDIFDAKLKVVNNKYIHNIILSEALSSISLTPEDITERLLIKNSLTMDKLFQGKQIKYPFNGQYAIKGHYHTKTPEATFLY